MNRSKRTLPCAIGIVLLMAGWSGSAFGQIGRQQGLVEPNVATEKDLLALPHMNDAIVKGIVEQRPYSSIVDLNTLLSKSLSKEQLTELYGKMFLHINLNSASRDEILLIPGAGNRMAREFLEYRPYKSLEQFRKEIGKYVGPKGVARFERFISIE